MKTIDVIVMVRSDSIVEMPWLNVEIGCGHQIWVVESLGDSNLVEKVKSRDSGIY